MSTSIAATSHDGIWSPGAHDVDRSNAGKLMQRLGLASYDELYALSIREPAVYWKAINDYCGVVWSAPYRELVDLSGGIEFPKWFPGGRLNWVETVLAWADDPAYRDVAAIVAEHETGPIEALTYAQLRDRIADFAAGLVRLGLGKGDRVGLLMDSGLESFVSYLSVAYVGGIVVPLFSGFGVEAVVARLSASKASMLLVSTGFMRRQRVVDITGLVRQAAERLPALANIVWKPLDRQAPVPKGLSWHDIGVKPPASQRPCPMDPNDPFLLIYTSGTTGKPKGPVHTHGSFPLRILSDASMHLNLSRGDVIMWPADMGWIVNSIVPVAALMLGATMVTYDGAPDYPDWSRMSTMIERHRVTHYGASPTLIRSLAANEAQSLADDTSSLQILITAGEAIDPEHFLWFHRGFGRKRVPVINYTGGTEVSGALLSSVTLRPIAPSSFNTASLGVDADVVDASGAPVTGQVGELVIRAPFVGMTKSFWEDDERYLESYWRTLPGLWVHGDLALRDERGFFFIRGRSDDTIKVAGKRLGPAEVEEAVVELEAVAEAAAIGVDDPLKGQRIVVFVVPEAGWAGTPSELERLVKDQVALRLGKPFRPSQVCAVRQLPKTRSSKVMRRVIRNIYGSRDLGDLSSLDNPGSVDELRSVIADLRTRVDSAPRG